MKSIFKIICSFALFFVSIYSVFAIEAPKSVMLDNMTENTISFSWEEVEGAEYYDIYFSDVQNFEIINAEKRDFHLGTNITISNLNPSTQYYFQIGATDSNEEKSELSQEYSFSTLDGEQMEFNSAADFKISTIEVLAKNQLTVSFTSPLEQGDDAERIFRVVGNNNETDEYFVKESKLDENNSSKVVITMDDNLPIDRELKLIVISIFDESGRNLQSGIESFEIFYVEEEIQNKYYNEVTDVIEITTESGEVMTESEVNEIEGNDQSGYNELGSGNQEQSENNQSQNNNNVNEGLSGNGNQNEDNNDNINIINQENQNNNQGEIENNSQEGTNNPQLSEGSETEEESNGTEEGGMNNELGINNNDSGTETSTELNSASEQINEDVYSAGEKMETLPTTGPTHILMLIIAIMLGGMAFVFKTKK